MSFLLSKLAWLLFNPATLLVLMLVLGVALLWSGAAGWGRRLVTVAAAVIVLVTVFPVGAWLTNALESRFPRGELPGQVAGVIVLGGSYQPGLARDRGVLALNGSAERLIAFARLARQYPQAQLVFTGGSGDPFDQESKEADVAGKQLAELGVPRDRLVLERESRNTWENAVLTRKLLGDRAAGEWILVTSARHMPRAIGAFRKAGWRVTAYPVDYQTRRRPPVISLGNPAAALVSLNGGLREWTGLVWYWVRGRSDSLFPSPAE